MPVSNGNCGLARPDAPPHCRQAGQQADLVDSLLATPVVRCDDVPWSLFGLSMAGWNMLLSVDIVALAMMSFIFGDRNRTRTS